MLSKKKKKTFLDFSESSGTFVGSFEYDARSISASFIALQPIFQFAVPAIVVVNDGRSALPRSGSRLYDQR